MLQTLRLERFKNFQAAELHLGMLTLLIGTNASGKSNLRDAFRFLHGIGRGYVLADIIGGKFGEGGERLWTGIRGGANEITFQGSTTFALELTFTIAESQTARAATYRIEVEPGKNGTLPRVMSEQLAVAGHGDFIFSARAESPYESRQLKVETRQPGADQRRSYPSHQPVITQLIESQFIQTDRKRIMRACLDAISSMRFVDLNPDAMRQPSFSGQTVLGDRGENLSSVLQSICADEQRKGMLIQWLQALTPMDAADFDFPVDQIGRILVTLVEAHGQRTTAYSASDGTLRFLGILATLLGPEAARFYFLEELENGIHPTRLHVLLQLIEHQVTRQPIQIVATTHSPQLLRLLSPTTLAHTSLTYRLEGRHAAQIMRILDIPDAQRVLADQDLARLHESGWMEDALAFTAADEDSPATLGGADSEESM